MTAHPRTAPAPRPARRGVAALTVVMVLFFVMALVAAYTNRNLIFEQRISANSYRATRALEAADAGVQWATAMLNGGRTNANCVAVDNPAVSDFRSRYIRIAPDQTWGPGAITVNWDPIDPDQRYPACITTGGAISCVCPAPGEAAADIGTAANGNGSTFRVTFESFKGNTEDRPGAITVVSTGCTSPGTGNGACYAQRNDAPTSVDSVAFVNATLGLVRALPVPPRATVTAGTTITAAPGLLQVANADFATGMTLHAGGAIDPGGRLVGPGGPGADTGLVASDPALNALAAAPVAERRWFRAMFGMDPATYQRQPAVVQIDCAATCSRDQIAAVLLRHPRNPIWANGDVNLGAGAALGSQADPMLLLVTGTLTVSGNLTVWGLAHANQINWTAAANWEGALVSETTFNATAPATLRYDKVLLETIQHLYGSFLVTPGSWNIQ